MGHIADTHLGHRRFRRTDAGAGREDQSFRTQTNQREEDVAAAFARVVDDVIAQAPDAVLVAGDVFDRPDPGTRVLLFAFRQFRRLREALPAAHIIVIAGNHEAQRYGCSPLLFLGELGVQVVLTEAQDLDFPALDLMIRAIPHPALVLPGRPPIGAAPGARRYQVAMLHGEAEGVFVRGEDELEYGGAFLSMAELLAGGWSYVALGHYHVAHEVGPMCWYAGATEYVSSNVWGEQQDETKRGVRGKGWLLVDLDYGTVEHRIVAVDRVHRDLGELDATGLDAAGVSEALRTLVGPPSAIAGHVVRVRISNIETVTRCHLDHALLRSYQTAALNFQLVTERPEVRTVGGLVSSRNGRAVPLTELVAEFLATRFTPAPDVDRAALVERGKQLMAEATAEYEDALGGSR